MKLTEILSSLEPNETLTITKDAVSIVLTFTIRTERVVSRQYHVPLIEIDQNYAPDIYLVQRIRELIASVRGH